jgi:putative N6-adenine-specific DNA methylase
MGLRAADRVLLEAGLFPATDFDALFDQTHSVPWESLVRPQSGLRVTKVRCNRSLLKAETSIQAVVHKAIAQRLCSSGGLARLPETGSAAEVRVYIEKDQVSLLLDLSGEPLFKRGYRLDGGIAPLRETTAAAILLLSGWKRKFPLYDPFCGSGTIIAEAQMYAWDMAPCLGRSFALCNLPIADAAIEDAVRKELFGKINIERTIRIAGSDEDAASVTHTLSNLRRVYTMAQNHTPMESSLQVNNLPMAKTQPPFAVVEGSEPCGFIVTNPPYGKRLGDPQISQRVYREMNALSRNFPGWKLAVITDNPGFESFFGRKADSCREISNGPIPSYFYQYEKL